MAPQIRPDPTLPAGWQCLYDPDSNAVYYWNKASGSTTYERPEAGPASVAAPPAVNDGAALAACWKVICRSAL